jgi:molybdopterin-guanine dinucleotide biosynthesis protein A
VAALAINANGDPARFSGFGLPVVADTVPGFVGPLAGVLAGLRWAEADHPGCGWVASIATDTPFFPIDLAARLMEAVRREGADLACAASAGRTHPVFGLWPVRLADALEAALVHDDMRKIDAWTARYRVAAVDFPAEPFDLFFNVNTAAELAEAERLLTEGAAGARMPG